MKKYTVTLLNASGTELASYEFDSETVDDISGATELAYVTFCGALRFTPTDVTQIKTEVVEA